MIALVVANWPDSLFGWFCFGCTCGTLFCGFIGAHKFNRAVKRMKQ